MTNLPDQSVITLVGEDGVPVQFDLIDAFDHDERAYVVLIDHREDDDCDCDCGHCHGDDCEDDGCDCGHDGCHCEDDCGCGDDNCHCEDDDCNCDDDCGCEDDCACGCEDDACGCGHCHGDDCDCEDEPESVYLLEAVPEDEGFTFRPIDPDLAETLTGIVRARLMGELADED